MRMRHYQYNTCSSTGKGANKMIFGREVHNKLPQMTFNQDDDSVSVKDRAYSCQGKAEVLL